MAIKLLNTYTNNNTNDPHGFKEQVKIKLEATKAIVGRFPNWTTALTLLLSKAKPALDWDGYCALPAMRRFEWERRANALNQALIYIMNSKNEITKKALRLAYFQGSYTVYPADIKAAAWYLSRQYPNNKPGNQQKTNREKGMIQNLKIRITPRVIPLGYTLRILQQMKTQPLLAEELI